MVTYENFLAYGASSHCVCVLILSLLHHKLLSVMLFYTSLPSHIMHRVGSLFLTMCQLHNSLEVEVYLRYIPHAQNDSYFYFLLNGQFLPVYHPSHDEMKEPKLYARNVQLLMARYVNPLNTTKLCFLTEI